MNVQNSSAWDRSHKLRPQVHTLPNFPGSQSIISVCYICFVRVNVFLSPLENSPKLGSWWRAYECIRISQRSCKCRFRI